MRVYFIIGVLIVWFILTTLVSYAGYWKKKASWALLQYGKNARWRDQRKEAARQALMAGNRDAAKLYALACPEKFDNELPLTPFYRNNIMCVFTDYYYSKRHQDWIAEDQWNFTRTVYNFKEGKDSCTQYFARAFRTLHPACELTIMFMPCSSETRYYNRFCSLSRYFSKYHSVHSGFDYINFIGERECKHTAQNRDEIDEGSNYTISEDVKGKKIVIVDDLLTTGLSLSSYADRLNESGAEVIGAIFLAKTFLLPSDFKVKWIIWKELLFSW